MSQLYIIPRIIQPDPAVVQMLQRSGITHVHAEKLYDLWPYLASGAKVLAEMDETTMALLLRYSTTLLETMPFIITGFPGSNYSPEWNMQSGHVTPVRFADFETQLLKSGHQANSLDQVAERALLDVEPPATRDLRRPDRPAMVRHTERPLPNLTENADEEFEFDD
nr:MAG: hypothetical protein 1 [Guangxi cysto-like virus 5]